MEAMWREAAAHRGGDYGAHLWVTVLAMLYGTGLRRGELERLNVDAIDRAEGTLRIGWFTGKGGSRPVERAQRSGPPMLVGLSPGADPQELPLRTALARGALPIPANRSVAINISGQSLGYAVGKPQTLRLAQ
jgi:integrase